MTLAVVATLAVVTIAFRAGGSALPASLTRRTAGLAPALLAALVMTEVTSEAGVPELDAKTAGVVAALVAAALRAPLAVTVGIGAAVAAVVRAVT
ncbi:MAG: AzlD domain-containing protein [Actinobacteria bacterium]|nr:AzlD domain-containing protein [Actinomycetota bacterium]